jgi:hypothetical protein
MMLCTNFDYIVLKRWETGYEYSLGHMGSGTLCFRTHCQPWEIFPSQCTFQYKPVDHIPARIPGPHSRPHSLACIPRPGSMPLERQATDRLD